MSLRLDVASRNAGLDSYDDQVNGGTPPATIEIRTGSPPANLTDADSGTLLATLTAGNPMFGNASSGTLTANAITADSSGDASGTPGYFRVKQGGTGTVKQQGTCGVTSQSTTGDLQFNTTISLGGNVSISSYVLTSGNA